MIFDRQSWHLFCHLYLYNFCCYTPRRLRLQVVFERLSRFEDRDVGRGRWISLTGHRVYAGTLWYRIRQ